MVCPRARGLDEFAWEVLGDEYVVLDARMERYHTLNTPARRMMELADGSRDVTAIASALYGDASATHLSFTRYGLDQLAAAGLLESRGGVTRRAALRLGISVVAGAGVIPVVSSIPVPVAAQGLSPNVRPTPVRELDNWQWCTAFDVVSVCKSGCCCYNKTISWSGVCKNAGDCDTDADDIYVCG